MNEYPKMLYGPNGWDDLDDCKMVMDAQEEENARDAGYYELPALGDKEQADNPVAKRRPRKAG